MTTSPSQRGLFWCNPCIYEIPVPPSCPGNSLKKISEEEEEEEEAPAELTNEILTYPNPFTNSLTISNCKSGILIEIFDQLGVSIYKQVMIESTMHINTIHFPSGVYFIHILNKVSKVVKL